MRPTGCESSQSRPTRLSGSAASTRVSASALGADGQRIGADNRAAAQAEGERVRHAEVGAHAADLHGLAGFAREAADEGDGVELLTLHRAKGLEWDAVFIPALEEGSLPVGQAKDDETALAEERRLLYVGITRAKQALYVTCAEQRRLHGMDSFSQRSRFISEIPDEYVEEIRPRVQVSRPARAARSGAASSFRKSPDAEMGVRLGQRVRHGKFGDGVILNYEGQGAHARVEVNFETAGTKWLVLSYANLDLM